MYVYICLYTYVYIHTLTYIQIRDIFNIPSQLKREIVMFTVTNANWLSRFPEHILKPNTEKKK